MVINGIFLDGGGVRIGWDEGMREARGSFIVADH
jgi:hypothetical protein